MTLVVDPWLLSRAETCALWLTKQPRHKPRKHGTQLWPNAIRPSCRGCKATDRCSIPRSLRPVDSPQVTVGSPILRPRSCAQLLDCLIVYMPDKAELKRRRAQSQRNKARNREEEAEAKRRPAQSQRDKARNRREEEERIRRIERAIQQQLALTCQPALPAAIPEAHPSTLSLVAIMEARSTKFMQDIARMFNDTQYSDATVLIHGKKLPVHKSIICTQSEYFEKAFQDAFVEGSSGELKFDDKSGAAYWRVFEYLYTGDYSDNLSQDFADEPALLKEPRVYALADMFFLEDLKALAIAKLQQKLQNLWTSDSFPECIREIYATTPESDHAMRSAVVKVAKDHVRELGKKDVFKDLIYEGGDFAVQYFESVIFPAPLTTSRAFTTWT